MSKPKKPPRPGCVRCKACGVSLDRMQLCKRCRRKVDGAPIKTIISEPAYTERMMPGETPYTDQEREVVRELVHDAAHADVTECDEVEGRVKGP